MPVSPWMAEDLSTGVRDLYADAEERLLAMVARRLADGIDAPQWMEAKLADIQVTAEVERIQRETGLTVPDPMQLGELP